MSVKTRRASPWLTKREAARRAKVSVRTLERWIQHHGLRTAGERGVVRLKAEWVDEFLENGWKHP